MSFTSEDKGNGEGDGWEGRSIGRLSVYMFRWLSAVAEKPLLSIPQFQGTLLTASEEEVCNVVQKR